MPSTADILRAPIAQSLRRIALRTLDDWEELRAEAARAHNNRTASYLLGMPLLADYLDEALSGISCAE